MSNREPTHRWPVAAIVLLLIGAGSLVANLLGQRDPVAGHPESSAVSTADPGQTAGLPPVSMVARPAVAARSVPVSIRIPAMGVSVSLSQLGLNADRSPQVPTKYQEPGWYKLGPAPGQMGSAVILGPSTTRTVPRSSSSSGPSKPVTRST